MLSTCYSLPLDETGSRSYVDYYSISAVHSFRLLVFWMRGEHEASDSRRRVHVCSTLPCACCERAGSLLQRGWAVYQPELCHLWLGERSASELPVCHGLDNRRLRLFLQQSSAV